MRRITLCIDLGVFAPWTTFACLLWVRLRSASVFWSAITVSGHGNAQVSALHICCCLSRLRHSRVALPPGAYNCYFCPDERKANGAPRDIARSYLSSEGTFIRGAIEDFKPAGQVRVCVPVAETYSMALGKGGQGGAGIGHVMGPSM